MTGRGLGCSPRGLRLVDIQTLCLQRQPPPGGKNGPISSAMTVMTMMTVFWRYTHGQGICHIHRHDRHHRHWGQWIPAGLAWCVGSALGAGRLRRQFLLSPYKDVIDDILAIVIIEDKDAVYDILARDDGRHKDIVLGYPWRQKPEGHPGAPAARESIFGGPGRGPFPAKRQTRKHGGKTSSVLYQQQRQSGLSRPALSHYC